MFKIIAAFLLVLFFAAPGFAVNAGENVVTKIVIEGNRAHEWLIRENLAFKEGDAVNDEKIAESKANLYALGLFKTLEITRVKDSSSGGTEIIVDARDGWYMLPIAMAGSRGQQGFFTGGLLEQNVFKDGERAVAFGNFQDSQQRYALGAEVNKFAFSATLDRLSYTEYQYQNGSYSSPIMSGASVSALQQYGQFANYYNRDESVLRLAAAAPLAKKLRGIAAINLCAVQYSAGLNSIPSDGGRIHVLSLALQYGKMRSVSNIAASVGRIFGLGMADLKENLKPLPATTIDYFSQTTLETSAKAIGSGQEFGKVSFSGSRTVNYTDRSSFEMYVKGGYGVNVPFSQTFVTDRSDGLEGVYAREFRGDKIAAANVSYRRPFFKSSRGQFIGEAFGELADCFFDSQQGLKEGAGFNIAYQFWRFPMPLGLGYTYSFDDNDWKASASLGFIF